MKRNITFEALRVIFIVFMIFHHLDTFNGFNIPNFTSNVKKLCFEGFVGVNFFFMLSGLGCVLGYKDKLDNGQITHGGFLYNRLAKLYPAYLLFLIGAVFLYAHGHIGNIKLFLTHVFMLQTFPITTNVAFGYNGVAWCVSASLFFYLIFMAIHRINFKQCVYYSAFLLIFVLMNIAYHTENGNVMGSLVYTNPVFRLLDFLTGMAIALWFREHPAKREGSTKLQIWSVVIFVIFVLIGAYGHVSSLYKLGLWYIFPCALLLIAFYNETKLSKKLFEHSFWLTLSGASMIIFLSHQELLNVVRIYIPISKFPVFYNYFWPWGVIGMVMIIVCISWIIDKFITRPLSNSLLKIKPKSLEINHEKI